MAVVRRWTSGRHVQVWWRELSPEEQREWYIRQQTSPAHGKRRFQDIVSREPDTFQYGVLEDEMDTFIPWGQFKLEGLLEGKQLPEVETE